jgi:hypothetical protein
MDPRCGSFAVGVTVMLSMLSQGSGMKRARH